MSDPYDEKAREWTDAGVPDPCIHGQFHAQNCCPDCLSALLRRVAEEAAAHEKKRADVSESTLKIVQFSRDRAVAWAERIKGVLALMYDNRGAYGCSEDVLRQAKDILQPTTEAAGAGPLYPGPNPLER